MRRQHRKRITRSRDCITWLARFALTATVAQVIRTAGTATSPDGALPR